MSDLPSEYDYEAIYQQVDDAIRRQLYCARHTRWSGSPAWRRPIRIERGDIVMLWGDCGSENRPEDLAVWTPEEWREAVRADGTGLYRKVGLWSFAPADDPAADLIAQAHRSPEWAGSEIYMLRQRVRELEEVSDE